MHKFLNLFFKGILVGIANIIPGVSGGTIAVVLNIFDRLIDAINNFFSNPKKHIKFLFPLIIGAISGIIIFSKVIEIFLAKESFPTSMFFAGLVMGSIPLIYKHSRKESVKPVYFIISIISFSVVVIMSFIKAPTISLSAASVNTAFLIKIFISAILASSAMVIPGISGSFIMMLLGIYTLLLSTINEFTEVLTNGIKLALNSNFSSIIEILKAPSFLILLAFGVGVIIGISIISKIIEILLKKAFSVTYFAILGLIFGSIFAIFKDPLTYSSYSQNNIPIFSIILGIIAIFTGFFISLKLGKE